VITPRDSEGNQNLISLLKPLFQRNSYNPLTLLNVTAEVVPHQQEAALWWRGMVGASS
jgi:hypothetical protein